MIRFVLTGGHLTPALALIEELKNNQKVEFVFFGRQYSTEGSKNQSAEYQIITKRKIKFHSISAGRFQRRFTSYTVPSLLKIPLGFLQAFFWLVVVRPKLIVSFGGYISAPVVFAGWLLGIDSITHEQAAIPGLATKINSLFVKKIFLSWSQSLSYFNNAKSEVIGNLSRKSFFSSKVVSKSIAKFLKTTKGIILITGGNQGSHFLNRITFELVKSAGDLAVLHQVGTANWRDDQKIAKSIKLKNYLAVDYIDPQDFGAVLKGVFLVISRAGANTVWDLAIAKKPAILVPLPISASGEQTANADILKKAGMARITLQKDLTLPKLKLEIRKMLGEIESYREAAAAFYQKLPRDATNKLTKYILSYT